MVSIEQLSIKPLLRERFTPIDTPPREYSLQKTLTYQFKEQKGRQELVELFMTTAISYGALCLSG